MKEMAGKSRISGIRKLFPVTGKSLYLNHSAVSPYSLRVSSAMKEFIDARTFSDDVDLYPGVLEKVDDARKNIALIIKAAPETIAFVKNTTEALNIVVRSIGLKPGERILLFSREFPANVYPFLNMERYGIAVDFVPERENRFYLEDIEKSIREGTRLLSVSHVEFLTGFRHDLAAIGEMCRKRGVLFCVDAIQSAGAVEIDVEKMKIDFIGCGGHKWLMGPMGTGFLFIRKSLLESLDPVFAGWLSVEDSWNFFNYKLRWLPSACRFEGATKNFIGLYGLRASTGLLLEVGLPLVEERILTLTDRLIDGLQERKLKVISPPDRQDRAGIVSFAIDDSAAVFERLKSRKVFIALREGFLRVAPHFYNTPEDMDRFLTFLDECRGSRS